MLGPLLELIQPSALHRVLDVGYAQELSATGQLGGDVATGQESVMANANEPLGQYMEQEPADEFLRR